MSFNRDKLPHSFRAGVALRIVEALGALKPCDILKSCITCDHFNEPNETCKISNNMRPPARIIAYGCPKYESIDDDIPF